MNEERLAEMQAHVSMLFWSGEPILANAMVECLDEIARLRAGRAESEAEIARLRDKLQVERRAADCWRIVHGDSGMGPIAQALLKGDL